MTIEFDGNFRQPEDITDLTTNVYKLISIFGENVTLEQVLNELESIECEPES